MRATHQSKPAEQARGAASGNAVRQGRRSRRVQPTPIAENPVVTASLASTPRLAAQRKQLQAAFGRVIQREARSGAGPAQLMPGPSTRPVVQCLANVKNNPTKLSFFIDECGRHAMELFTNAEQVHLSQFIQHVNVYWRAAYSGNDNELTWSTATAALKSHLKELLESLGKDAPEKADYERLAAVVKTTFEDETDALYGIATKKETIQTLPPGSEWWLNRVQQEGLIEAEDKSGDERLMDSSQDHIVKTGADSAATATALFKVNHKNSGVEEINEDDRVWELHGHVRKNGDVEFAHTKADGEHKVTVDDWFGSHIEVEDREWKAP